MGLLATLWGGSTTLAKWENVPNTLYVGQIFGVDIHFLFPLDSNQDIPIFFENGINISIRHIDMAEKKGIDITKRIYFKVEDIPAKLPDISFEYNGIAQTLPGQMLNVTTLKAPLDFCQVLAKSFKILEYESVQYNKNSNLVLLKVEGEFANLEDFHIPYASIQKIKEKRENFPKMQILYYATIPSQYSRLHLSYFDTTTREFKKISLPIKVKDETVSTQSDINPTEDENRIYKIVATAGFGALFVIFGIFRKKFFTTLLGLLLLGLAGYKAMPLKKVCIKKGTKIYILPTKQSTVFDIAAKESRYFKLNEANGYIKIILPNKKIGWVKKDDTCQN